MISGEAMSVLSSSEEQGQRDALGKLLGLVPAFRQSILFDAEGRDLAMVSRISQGSARELLAPPLAKTASDEPR